MNKKAAFRIIFLLVVTVLIAECGMFVSALLRDRKADQVAAVGPYSITKQELSFHMKNLQAQVQNEFQTQYHVTLGKDDWSTEFEGRKPLDELREKALEESIRDKVFFILAKEEHLVDYVDYSDLLKAMKKENQIREEAAAHGEIVYGLKNFSVEPYYSHVLSSIKTALKEALSKNEGDPLYIGKGEVEAYFHANKSDWTAKATSYKVTRLTIAAEQKSKSTVQAKINRLVSDKVGIGALQSGFRNAQAAKEVLTEESGSNLNSFDYELLSKLKGLTAGEMTAAIETREGFVVYRLDAVVFDETKALQEYEYQIKQQMLNEKLDEYIDNYRNSLKIKMDSQKMSSVTIGVS